MTVLLLSLILAAAGLLLTCLMYGTVYGRNLLAWREKKRHPRTQWARDPEAPQVTADAWLQGYEWALANLRDDGVQADLRRLTPASAAVPPSRPSPTTGVH